MVRNDARSYAKRLGVGLAIVDKRREGPNRAHAMQLIGDVKGKIAVVLDDMIDTAGTMTKQEICWPKMGLRMWSPAPRIRFCLARAVERLISSAFSQVIVTDTIPLNPKAAASDKFKVISVGSLIAKAIPQYSF